MAVTYRAPSYYGSIPDQRNYAASLRRERRKEFTRDRDLARSQYLTDRGHAEGLFNQMMNKYGQGSGGVGTGSGGGGSANNLSGYTQQQAAAGRRSNIQGLQSALASTRGLDPAEAAFNRRQILAGYGQAQTANQSGALNRATQTFATIDAPERQNAFAAQMAQYKAATGLQSQLLGIAGRYR